MQSKFLNHSRFRGSQDLSRTFVVITFPSMLKILFLQKDRCCNHLHFYLLKNFFRHVHNIIAKQFFYWVFSLWMYAISISLVFCKKRRNISPMFASLSKILQTHRKSNESLTRQIPQLQAVSSFSKLSGYFPTLRVTLVSHSSGSSCYRPKSCHWSHAYDLGSKK